MGRLDHADQRTGDHPVKPVMGRLRRLPAKALAMHIRCQHPARLRHRVEILAHAPRPIEKAGLPNHPLSAMFLDGPLAKAGDLPVPRIGQKLLPTQIARPGRTAGKADNLGHRPNLDIAVKVAGAHGTQGDTRRIDGRHKSAHVGGVLLDHRDVFFQRCRAGARLARGARAQNEKRRSSAWKSAASSGQRPEKGLGRVGDETNSVAKCLDRLGSVIRDLDAELFFERHDQLNGVQAVCAQIVDEGCGVDDFDFVHAQVFHNDLLHAVRDAVAHMTVLILCRGKSSRPQVVSPQVIGAQVLPPWGGEVSGQSISFDCPETGILRRL
mmetsp:Transcript_29164/g.56279  ORF Transcript_29164/g.56279 Transcript_29164/m.56279 type:complete len:325 (+) Transcript_29164:2833-3807(+)